MDGNGYFIDAKTSDFGPCFVPTTTWRDEFVQVMISSGVTSLRLSRSAGWSGKDISFISELDFLSGIEIYDWNTTDISPIVENKALRLVGIQCTLASHVDFSIFKKLEVCKIFWNDKIKGLFNCTALRHLDLVDYPFENLLELSELSALRRLHLSSRKILTLRGIANLNSLENLDLATCSKLVDVSDIAECKNLISLEIRTCRKIGSLPNHLLLPRLKALSLSDCGKIESLKPLSSCQKLETLRATGDTVIVDGDFDFLLTLPALKDAWYANKKHYSLPRELLMQKISISNCD